MEAEELVKFLRNMQTSHREELPSGASSLIDALIACAAPSMKAKGVVDFDKAEVMQFSQNVSPENMRKRVQLTNTFFSQIDFKAQLKSRKSHFELSFDEDDIVAANNLPSIALAIASKTHTEDYQSPKAFPEKAVFVSHKWQNPEVMTVLDAFVAELERHLSNPPEGKEPIRLYFDRSKSNGFEHHDVRDQQQDNFCNKAQLCLILWSKGYDSSEACKREAGFFLDEKGADQLGKSAIIILEHDRLQDVPQRFKVRNIYLSPDADSPSLVGFWEKAKESGKTDYVAKLCDSIYKAFQQQKKPAIAETIRSEERGYDTKILEANEHALEQNSEYICTARLVDPAAYRQETNERLDLIPALVDWAVSTNSLSPRVTVLLGDFGYGKTISCRLFTKALSDEYGKSSDSPLPLYLDLKALQGTLEFSLDKPIEHLLETMLSDTGEELNISGTQVIQFIQKNHCVVIFDGFDEIGQSLDEAQQQRIYHKLLNIIPAEVYRQDAKKLTGQQHSTEPSLAFKSKILISCRTHFFTKLQTEDSFLSGSNRHPIGMDQVGSKNIQRFYMAPFSKQAVKEFMCDALGEDEGVRAYQLLGDIHDLSELSAHPIMLSLICRHIPKLKMLSIAGKPVNSATLYLQIFDEIGHRDIEKHKIRLSDKQELLASLALHLWKTNRTHISYKQLDRWFVDYGNNHPVIKNQLAGIDALHLLMQDLCNACLLVRDGSDQYRFSHTSYLEFFRALGIFEAIRNAAHSDTLDILTGSVHTELGEEALQFLVNWHQASEPEERTEFNANFIALIEKDASPAAKMLGFSLWKFAQLYCQKNALAFPHSHKANWSELSFTEDFIPHDLKHLDFSEINLSHSRFHLVQFCGLNLCSAKFANCVMSQCYFHQCSLTQSDWREARIDADCFYPPDPESLNSEPATIISPPISTIYRNDGHTARVNSVAFSADGQQLLSGSGDHSLKLWNARTGKLIRTLEGHAGSVNSVAFSADGRQLLSGSFDGSLKLWNPRTGDLIRTLEGHSGEVNSVAFSADGQQLLSGSDDHSLKLWNARTGELIRTLEGHSSGVTSVAFSADGQQLLSGSDDSSLKLWNARTGDLIRTLEGHFGPVGSVAFSADGQQLLSGSYDGKLKLWSARTGELIHTLEGHSSFIVSVAFSADGQQLLSGSCDHSLKLWNARTGELIRTLEGHSDSVSSVSFSADGQQLLSGSDDRSLKLWNARTGDLIRAQEGYSGSVTSVVFSADGQQLLSGSDDDSLKLWNARTGELIRTLKGHSRAVCSVAFSADGQQLLSGSDDRSLKLWNARTGELIRTLEGHSLYANSVAFSADGQQLLSGSYDHSLKLWNARTGELIRTFEGHAGPVVNAAFSADGRQLISGSFDECLKLWNARTGELIHTLEGHSGSVNSVAFSTDGQQLLSGSNDGNLKLWNARTGELIRTLEGHSSGVNSVAFSADGQRLLSGSDDHSIKLWSALTGELIRTLEGHSDWVRSVAFSADGRQLLSGSSDGSLKLWNAQTGICTQTIVTFEGASFISYGSSTNVDASPCEITLKAAGGIAWRFLHTKSADGKLLPANKYADWGSVYKP